MSGPIDSHCHLQSFEAGERDEVLDRARERGVSGFLVPAIHLGDADALLDLCDRHDDVWCALGVHPHEAKRWQATDARRLEEYLEHPRVVAVGECGLDFHYDLSPRDQQLRAMRAQWEVALDRGYPVILHNRESDELMGETFRDPAFAGLGAVFHSFSGTMELLEIALAGGAFVGYSGMVTFNRAENVRGALAASPLDRVLVETDSPYLAPVPHRGKRNEPAYVVEVAERVGHEKGLDPTQIASTTCANFFRCFPGAGRGEGA